MPALRTAPHTVDPRRTIARTVLVPGDPGYEERRALRAGGYDRRPALIVVPADTAEVGRAVALARDSGLELAVRSVVRDGRWSPEGPCPRLARHLGRSGRGTGTFHPARPVQHRYRPATMSTYPQEVP